MAAVAKDKPAGVSGHGTLSPSNLDNILIQLATRIDSLMAEEASMTIGDAPELIDQFVTRKNHLALEASRLEKHLGSHTSDPDVRLKLSETVRGLSQSADRLRRQIEAVEEIVTVLVDIHRNSASDGTYTAAAPLGAKAR